MRKIAELNMLVRARIELPVGLKLATDEFREGWNFIWPEDTRWLKEQMQPRGWSLIKSCDGPLRSGVGETSQEAIASALKHALRFIGKNFHAVEVEQINLTAYPWFFLARVTVHPYWIQKGTALPVPDRAMSFAHSPRRRRLPHKSDGPYPEFASAIPQIRQMPISSQGSEEGLR